VDQALPLVRIAVVQLTGKHEPLVVDSSSGERPGDACAGSPRDTIEALERLGDEVDVELFQDGERCLADFASQTAAQTAAQVEVQAECGAVDLVVLDSPLTGVALELLDALHAGGPPAIVVIREEGNDTALEAFRRGAADCVRVGADYAQVLPEMALEQIQRWREAVERRSAARRIRWLERLHDAIVSEIPAALVVLDVDSRVVTINPECSRLFGIEAEQVEGCSYESVLPADLIESADLAELLADAAQPRSVAPRMARATGADGVRRILDVRAQRLDEEGCTLLVLSDVTEGELQAERLSELERYNENIIQNMNSALLVVDADGRVSFANTRAETILGADHSKLSGRLISDWFDPTRSGRGLIAQTLAEGVSLKGAETLITREDGRVCPIGISCSPLLNADGSKQGAVAIFQDLTEIKQLQRQVLQTEKMASIGQLAAGVAHEINNPMGFIHANLFQMAEYLDDLRDVWSQVEALQEAVASGQGLDAVEAASAELRRRSEEIDLSYVQRDFTKAVRESQEGSERIRHIVSDLRDFSYQDTAEPMLGDVNQCVDSTASIVWTMMKHSVELTKNYEELPRVRCFPMQLKQVFMNLLVNAYHAIEEQLEGTGGRGEIEICTTRRDGGVVVTIRDSGVGISQSDVGRIFDPFFTTKEVGTGTGLGLSTSYSIIQRHGGTIQVESEPKCGSTFEVWLPEHGGRGMREEP